MAKREKPTEPDVITTDVGVLTVVQEGFEQVVDPDQQFVEQAGQAVKDFLARAGAFFTEARVIEKAANDRLALAKTLTVPTTADEDVTLQERIKSTTAATKHAIEHWSIAQALHHFHRRITSARARGVDPNEQANTIQNRLHNTYVENERRKAAEETERLRREAEAKAQADRDAEVARQEAEAARAEAAAPTLSERESTFVDLVVAGNKPSQAAQRAGFKNPATVGPQLLDRPKIQRAIEAKEQAAAIRAQAAATKEQPLDVQYETAKPDVKRAAGASDRTTHGAQVMDEAALIDAVFAGRYGIPRDILVVDHSKVNTYGKDLKELINKWPGVRYTKNTKVV